MLYIFFEMNLILNINSSVTNHLYIDTERKKSSFRTRKKWSERGILLKILIPFYKTQSVELVLLPTITEKFLLMKIPMKKMNFFSYSIIG